MTERTSGDEIEEFIDELIENLMATPDEELLAEATQDHGSVAAGIAGIADEISVAINSLAKDRLAETSRFACASKAGADRDSNFSGSEKAGSEPRRVSIKENRNDACCQKRSRSL